MISKNLIIFLIKYKKPVFPRKIGSSPVRSIEKKALEKSEAFVCYKYFLIFKNTSCKSV